MDLGACPHTHSKKLKDDYERAREAATSSTNTEDLKYTLPELDSLMAEYERNIFGFVDECDRRIRAAQRRLEKTPEENNKTTALVRFALLSSALISLIDAQMRDIGEIQTAYEAAMAEVEALGALCISSKESSSHHHAQANRVRSSRVWKRIRKPKRSRPKSSKRNASYNS